MLLPAVAKDPDRLARFRREAQVLASFNHPNITHIHGFDTQEGNGQDATVFIGLEIELTKQSTTVSGSVTDDHNDFVLDATVVVFPDEPAKWGSRSHFIGSARPDRKGRFTINGLPPGRFIAIVVDYLEPGEERDPDLLEKWRPRGTGLTLADGESHTLDLKLAAR